MAESIILTARNIRPGLVFSDEGPEVDPEVRKIYVARTVERHDDREQISITWRDFMTGEVVNGVRAVWTYTSEVYVLGCVVNADDPDDRDGGSAELAALWARYARAQRLQRPRHRTSSHVISRLFRGVDQP